MGIEQRAGLQDEVARLVADLAPEGASSSEPGPAPDVALGDLGYDSLACADLALALEERFGIRLVDADVEAIREVRDVVAAVGSAIEPRPRIPAGIGRLQGAVKTVAGWAFTWHSRLRVSGRENVPLSGPVVLAPNHRSMLDIPLLVMASPRPVVFMAKHELYRRRFLAWAFHEMGGFPVRREMWDLRAVDVALALLQRGEAIGVYPEGTRNRGGTEMLPFLRGAAWLALHVGAPIVPCGISGTGDPAGRDGRLGPRGWRLNVRVAFGQPLQLEPASDPEERRARAAEVTGRLREAIAGLLEDRSG